MSSFFIQLTLFDPHIEEGVQLLFLHSLQHSMLSMDLFPMITIKCWCFYSDTPLISCLELLLPRFWSSWANMVPATVTWAQSEPPPPTSIPTSHPPPLTSPSPFLALHSTSLLSQRTEAAPPPSPEDRLPAVLSSAAQEHSDSPRHPPLATSTPPTPTPTAALEGLSTPRCLFSLVQCLRTRCSTLQFEWRVTQWPLRQS